MDLRNEKACLEYLGAAIENDKLSLPTLPDIALSVRQAINSGKASDLELARLIASDAALSARLMQVANSPLYRAKQKVDTLKTAITRLGHNTVRNLVTSLAMKQLFRPSSKLLESYFHDIWQQSIQVAAVSRALALRCRHLNPEQAMLAGLIHQIGKLPVLTLAERFPELTEDPSKLWRIMENLHTVIGKMIMDTWDLPESISRAAWEYKHFERSPESPADYVDLVQVAYLENRMVNQAPVEVDLQTVTAFSKLGLDPNPEIRELKDFYEDIQEARSLLS